MVQVISSIDIYLDSVVRLEVVYELKLALGQVPSLSPASGDFYYLLYECPFHGQ